MLSSPLTTTTAVHHPHEAFPRQQAGRPLPKEILRYRTCHRRANHGQTSHLSACTNGRTTQSEDAGSDRRTYGHDDRERQETGNIRQHQTVTRHQELSGYAACYGIPGTWAEYEERAGEDSEETEQGGEANMRHEVLHLLWLNRLSRDRAFQTALDRNTAGLYYHEIPCRSFGGPKSEVPSSSPGQLCPPEILRQCA